VRVWEDQNPREEGKKEKSRKLEDWQRFKENRAFGEKKPEIIP